MAEFNPASLPGRGIKPLVSLLAHPRIALIAFLLVTLAGIPVVFIKGKTYYSSTATVQVAPRYMKNLRDDGELSFPSNTQYREFLEQQTKSVLRYDIVQDALRSLGDMASVWRRGNESERLTIDRLRAQMAVAAVADTYMIEISLQSTQKEGLAEIVNAVVNTYVDRMKSERIYGSDVRVRNLEERETELLRIIQDKLQQRTGLALQLGISAFSGKEENPYDRVLADLRSALAEARSKRFDAEAKLHAFQTRGETDITTRSIQEAVLIDPGLANLKSNLYKRRADLLTQLAGLTPDHPVRIEMEEEMQRIDTEIATQTGSLTQDVRNSLLARYQATVDQARQVEGDLANEFAEQEKLGVNYANLYNQAITLTLDLDQDRKELDAVRDRLNELAAEANSFGFVRLVTPALPPELPFGPGKKQILLLVLGVALFAAVAAPVGRDLLDQRVHTVNDAERVLGVPSLGWLVERDDAATRMFGEDLLRRIAGSLIREQESNGTRVFAFSAVKPGAGASETVIILGHTLNALGYPTLVIEANAFKPDARLRPAGGKDAPGLAQCLRQEADASACITPAEGDMPDRIWVGNTGSSRHLDRLDRIGELCKRLGEEYRFILVDIPPLLLSADAEILAHNLDHIILVVEAEGIVVGELRRAGRELEKLEPAAVGVLVNRVRPFAGGGYLRNLMLEYLTGRKPADYFSQPAWVIALRMRLATLASWRPRPFSRKP